MERVHHQLESSLPELKDLQAKGIFSPQEIKLIIKRRTDYEIQLVRRQPRKKDFLEYIEYEMTLEKLRKKRLERLSASLIFISYLPSFIPMTRCLLNLCRPCLLSKAPLLEISILTDISHHSFRKPCTTFCIISFTDTTSVFPIRTCYKKIQVGRSTLGAIHHHGPESWRQHGC
jgi:hypothetical protein